MSRESRVGDPRRRASAGARAVGWRGACAILLAACAEPLTDVQVIERPRVLAAHVAVEGDDARAWPAPGEGFRSSWLVVDPDQTAARSWHLEACPMAPVRMGVPLCAAPPFAKSSLDEPAFATPGLTTTTPQAAALEPAGVIAVLGVICTESEPVLDGAGHATGCTGSDEQTTLVSQEIWVGRGAEANHHPSLTTDRVTLDGEVWERSPHAPPGPTAFDAPLPSGDPRSAGYLSPGAPCAVEAAALGPALPTVSHTAGEARLVLAHTAGDREPIDDEVLSETHEALQLSVFSTAGKLSPPVSYIEGAVSVTDPEATLDLELPENGPDAGGQLVRVVLVLRDPRGGVDWSFRDFCLLP